MSKYQIGAVVVFGTDNELLNPQKIDLSTVAATEATRKAVVEHLRSVKQVLCVMSAESAFVMLHANRIAMEEMGLGDNLQDAPDDYVPPSAD